MLIPLDWQKIALNKTFKCLDDGYNRILITAPTGAGKAFLLMFIIKMLNNRGKKCLLLVDRTKLLSQLCESADKFNFDYNVISGNVKQFEEKLLTIATIQTYYKLKNKPEFDAIVIDECHTLYNSVIEHMKSDKVFIGCTATPSTHGLKKYYPRLISTVTQLELERDNIFNAFRYQRAALY